MPVRRRRFNASGIKFTIRDDAPGGNAAVIARARLYFIRNDLHARPYAYVEDVFVEPQARGKGVALNLLTEMLRAARDEDCYKVVAASRHGRPEVHRLYLKLGFRDHGTEFRMNL